MCAWHNPVRLIATNGSQKSLTRPTGITNSVIYAQNVRFHTCTEWIVALTPGAMLDMRERFPDVLDFKLGEYSGRLD
jgi:hypothetical protein